MFVEAPTRKCQRVEPIAEGVKIAVEGGGQTTELKDETEDGSVQCSTLSCHNLECCVAHLSLLLLLVTRCDRVAVVSSQL